MQAQRDLIESLKDVAMQIDDVKEDWHEMRQDNEEVATEIKNKIPEVPDLRNRSKRFLGSMNPFTWLGQSLFGLASNSDVRRLAMAVRHLQNTQEGSLDQFKAFKK